MIITACGEGCLKIQTGGVTLMIEPVAGELSGRFKPDIILKTRYEGETPLPQGSEPFVIAGPGEYEVKDIEVRGYPKGAYRIKAEDMIVGVLSEGGVEVLEPLEEVDVLCTPAAPEAEKVIKQLEPKIVIPTSKNFLDLAKAFNQKPTPQEKITLKKKDITTNFQILALTI